jgi:membrane associated rhomboid family serine protease
MGRFQAIPPVVKNLIIINVLVFLAQKALDPTLQLTEKIALFPLASSNFHGYQIFTHMFAHGGFGHIIFNMFALWMFGSVLENLWGAKRFLIFYLACGLGSAFLHLVIQHYRFLEMVRDMPQYDPQSIADNALGPALGASGAIMGLFVAFGYLFPNSELIILPIPFPIKAKWAVVIFMGIDLFGGIANVSGDNIAHFAHLGGAIAGLLIVWIWNRTNRKRFY